MEHYAEIYARMCQTEDKLATEVAAWLERAEAADVAKDAEHGPVQRGDEPPVRLLLAAVFERHEFDFGLERAGFEGAFLTEEVVVAE